MENKKKRFSDEKIGNFEKLNKMLFNVKHPKFRDTVAKDRWCAEIGLRCQVVAIPFM